MGAGERGMEEGLVDVFEGMVLGWKVEWGWEGSWKDEKKKGER